MPVNLKGRSFLTLMDFTPEEIRYLLDLSHDLKSKKRAGIVLVRQSGHGNLIILEPLVALTAAVPNDRGVTDAAAQRNLPQRHINQLRTRFLDKRRYTSFGDGCPLPAAHNMARTASKICCPLRPYRSLTLAVGPDCVNTSDTPILRSGGCAVRPASASATALPRPPMIE